MNETLADFERRVKEAASATAKPYEAGYDCGQNGPNTTNCALANFATRERTQDWERGKRDGEAAKATR